MDKNKRLDAQRERRRFRVRNKVRGNASQPRLSIHRTLNHFSCQLIDDETGKTLCAASSQQKGVSSSGGNCEGAAAVGRKLAELAKSAGVTRVAFDRGHTKFHGRVKAFADAAREGGLEF